MTTATVVLCPPLPGASATYDASDVADALLDHVALGARRVLSPSVPDPEPGDDARTARAHWVAHLAVAMATSGVQAPVMLVLAGSAGSLAAAIGFSQRASRRSVSRYVLVDAAVPAADDRSGDLVVRLHEAVGARTTATVRVAAPIEAHALTDLLERCDDDVWVEAGDAHAVTVPLRPHELRTLRLRRA